MIFIFAILFPKRRSAMPVICPYAKSRHKRFFLPILASTISRLSGVEGKVVRSAPQSPPRTSACGGDAVLTNLVILAASVLPLEKNHLSRLICRATEDSGELCLGSELVIFPPGLCQPLPDGELFLRRCSRGLVLRRHAGHGSLGKYSNCRW